MKYLFLIFSLSMLACKSDDSIMPNDDIILGLATQNSIYSKWQLADYETNEKIPYEVIVEFKNEKNEKGSWILKGKSVINFYEADFELSKQTIKINNLVVTAIGGNSAAMAFEQKYLKRLTEVSIFSLENGLLTLSSTNQKMTFKLIN